MRLRIGVTKIAEKCVLTRTCARLCLVVSTFAALALVLLSSASCASAYSSKQQTSPSAQADAVADNVLRRRHDYKYAFKRPFYLYNDSYTIPHYQTVGSVLKNVDSIRLTPSVPLQRGAVYSEAPYPNKEWVAEFSFSVAGKSYFGGEGFAFWYTKLPIKNTGDYYGTDPTFDGLAIVFDTADQLEHRYTPYIYGVLNDGTQNFLGDKNYVNNALGGCFRDYRSVYTGAVWVRVSNYASRVKVEVDLRQNGKSYSECFSAEGVVLPPDYYFGISAMTGEHLADDHDIYSFDVYEVNPPEKLKGDDGSSDYKWDDKVEDKIKKAEEFASSVFGESVDKAGTPHKQDDLPSITPNSFLHLQESQFKIIENIEILAAKVEKVSSQQASILLSPALAAPPSGGSGSKPSESVIHGQVASDSARCDHVVEELHSATTLLSDKLKRVQESVDSLQRALMSSHQAIQQKLDKVELTTATATSKGDIGSSCSSGAPFWLYIAIVIVAQIAIVWLHSWLKRKKDNPKKFI